MRPHSPAVPLVLLLSALCALPASARGHHRRRGPATNGACESTCGSQGLYAQRAPQPDAADAEVLKLCPAAPGERVEPQSARAFFLARLRDRQDQRLSQAVAKAAPFAKTPEQKADWLASIWTGPARRNAFTHVLCGDDWDKDKLGGLHLEARYAQVEREGKVCYQGPAGGGAGGDGRACDGQQCLIRYRGAGGFSCGQKAMGGFVQGLDSVDLLSAGTRAFAACCMGGAAQDESSATGHLRDGGRYAGPHGQTFQIWCGNRNGQPGIATFYPIQGRPNCRD